MNIHVSIFKQACMIVTHIATYDKNSNLSKIFTKKKQITYIFYSFCLYVQGILYLMILMSHIDYSRY